MSFSNMLFNSLLEIPPVLNTENINHFLPKSIDICNDSFTPFSYPLAYGHVSSPAGLKLSFSPFIAFCMIYVTKGSGTLSIQGRHTSLVQDSFAFVDCRQSLTISNELPGFEYSILYFNGLTVGTFYEKISTYNSLMVREFRSTGLLSPLRHVFAIASKLTDVSPEEIDNFLSTVEFNRAITDLLSEFTIFSSLSIGDKTSNASGYLFEIHDYIDHNYFTQITLDDLSTLFCINKYRLCREFTARYHQSPIQYMHSERIKKARELLAETGLKIHEIGYQVGYDNPNHFIHHFKKNTGRTPAEYRQKNVR